MSIADSDDVGDENVKENKSNDREKRERDGAQSSQQPGQASGTDERPPKARRVKADATQKLPADDDPVVLARQALDMFRKEVESDGDYEEPDTTPGEIDIEARSKKKTASTGTAASASKSAGPYSNTEDAGASRFPKSGRQPIIMSHFDDPSIL